MERNVDWRTFPGLCSRQVAHFRPTPAHTWATKTTFGSTPNFAVTKPMGLPTFVKFKEARASAKIAFHRLPSRFGDRDDSRQAVDRQLTPLHSAER